ncbi:MAG: glycosyltransferase [Candidatus Latescibacteria bacterium]|nr:glycosyltransferase [Candidatus Latescibacterota bacterium]
MRISIVVLTYRRREAVLNLLGCLARMRDADHEVIVVDNGGGDDAAAAVRAAHPGIRLLVLPHNTGVGARNRGIETATGDVVVTLDDDMVDFGDAELVHIRAAFAARPRLGALCFKVTWPGTDRVRDWVHRRPVADADATFPTYEVTEGAVAWRRSALLEAGGYREDFFISHEGLDLAYRLLDRGLEIVYDGGVRVGHDHRASGRPGWQRYYYDTRNLIWIAVLHQPVSYAAGYLLRGLGSMLVYSLRDGHLLSWLRAVRDGLLRVPGLARERRVWSADTRAYIAAADAYRPGFWTLARRRWGQKGFSLE